MLHRCKLHKMKESALAPGLQWGAGPPWTERGSGLRLLCDGAQLAQLIKRAEATATKKAPLLEKREKWGTLLDVMLVGLNPSRRFGL
jgi:hypothetical protein